MAVLDNPRHERFAQALAKGVPQTEAYVNAGYNENKSAASRLADDVNVCKRLAELQERGAIRAEISVASITEKLLRLSEKGEALGDAPGIQAARAAAMDAAKLNGLVVDKTESTLSVRDWLSTAS